MHVLLTIVRENLRRFRQDENGAITVDWVVLTAAVVGLSIAIYTTLGNDAHDHAERIGTAMSAQGIKTY